MARGSFVAPHLAAARPFAENFALVAACSGGAQWRRAVAHFRIFRIFQDEIPLPSIHLDLFTECTA